MRYVSAAAAALLVTLGQLRAQSPASSSLPAGTPVRAAVPLREGQGVESIRKFEGTVVRHTSSTLTISVEKPMCAILCDTKSMEIDLAIDSLRYVEIPVGRSRWTGAFRGLVVGGVLGVLAWQVAGIECSDAGVGADCRDDGSRPSQGEYLAEGGAVGAAIGGWIGWMVGVVRWERVDFRAAPIAATNGVNLVLTIRR